MLHTINIPAAAFNWKNACYIWWKVAHYHDFPNNLKFVSCEITFWFGIKKIIRRALPHPFILSYPALKLNCPSHITKTCISLFLFYCIVFAFLFPCLVHKYLILKYSKWYSNIHRRYWAAKRLFSKSEWVKFRYSTWNIFCNILF